MLRAKLLSKFPTPIQRCGGYRVNPNIRKPKQISRKPMRYFSQTNDAPIVNGFHPVKIINLPRSNP